MKMNIRISGTGGQGVISTGIVLGHSFVADGLNVVQTQSYGAESRGGAAKADLIVSDETIYELGLMDVSHFLALAPSAWEKYKSKLTADATVLVSTDRVHEVDRPHYGAPFFELSHDVFGRYLYANMMMIGAFAKIVGRPSLESIRTGIQEELPRFHDENIKAAEYGYNNISLNLLGSK